MRDQGASDPGRTPTAARHPAGEVARLFLKLGLIGFGGPAAHIALMEDEVVRRRRWLTRERFLDLLGATNLIPGPNSTEMAIHVGFARAGWPGLVTGGACFILPATLITLALAAAYARYGRLPEAGWILYGVKPVIIAVVVQAVWGLARKAIVTPLTAATAGAVLVLSLLGASEVLLLFAAALGLPSAPHRRDGRRGPNGRRGGLARPHPRGRGRPAPWPGSLGRRERPSPAARPGLPQGRLDPVRERLRRSSRSSGRTWSSGLRWLTDAQLLDAVAVGQLTPGPVLTTATFIGYLVAGDTGGDRRDGGDLPAVLRLRGAVEPADPAAPGSRPGPPASSTARTPPRSRCMATVTWQLGRSAVVDWVTAALALTAVVVLLSTRLNSAWLVAGGAAAGGLGALLR